MNWVILQGKAEIDDKKIRFLANNDNGEEKAVSTKIKCDRYFDSGTIQFKVNFKKTPEAIITVLLGDKSSRIAIAFNSAHATKGCFSIRMVSNGNKILSQSGSEDFLKANHDYDVKIGVVGSTIEFYVSNVLVCSAITSFTNSQVEIGCSGNDDDVIISDFHIKSQKPQAFVVMQFSEDFNDLYQEVIKPVCESFGYECKRADEYFTNGSILQDIIQSIKDSSIIIADITPNNPNVFYELGYAHAIAKPTILLSDKKRDKLPFDISGFRTLFYDNTIAGKSAVENKLREHLHNIK